MLRLNKRLSELGYGSRRACDRLISEGLVRVNGKPGLLGMMVTNHDDVEVLNRGPLFAQKTKKIVVIALNKPRGVITTADTKSTKTVFDLISSDQRLFSIGRLDVDSSGLLLLTNDGDLANHLTHPRYGHEKEYLVETKEIVSERDINRLQKGIVLDGKKTAPARVWRDGLKLRMCITEGRNRQIRRMMSSLRHRVTSLTRTRIANIELGNLAVGKWRALSVGEIAALKK